MSDKNTTKATAVTTPEASIDSADMAELIALREENAKLKAAKEVGITLKVSQKGAVSVYGLGRFPVTLYKGQWERLIGKVEDIKSFIKTNVESLSVKDKA